MTDRQEGAPVPQGDEPTGARGQQGADPLDVRPGVARDEEAQAYADQGEHGVEGEPVEGEPVEDELIEGEFVEPTSAAAAEADALLAEALDADSIEAQFAAAEAEASAVAGSTASGEQVAALTADLQRVHAEYSNYRKRVERDRELVRQRAVEAALVELLPVLDDIGRARQHDELVGAFRAVGESLESVVAKLGLTPFGEVGEAFDPTRHEALMVQSVEGIDTPTVVAVFQAGYVMNGRIVRPARVAVAGTD